MKSFSGTDFRDYRYDLYPLKSADELMGLLAENPELCGLNVTIPYKEKSSNFLNAIDPRRQTALVRSM